MEVAITSAWIKLVPLNVDAEMATDLQMEESVLVSLWHWLYILYLSHIHCLMLQIWMNVLRVPATVMVTVLILMVLIHVHVMTDYCCNLMDTRVDVEVYWLQLVAVSTLKDGPEPTDQGTSNVNGSFNYQTMMPPSSSPWTRLHLVSMEILRHRAPLITFSSLMGLAVTPTPSRRYVVFSLTMEEPSLSFPPHLHQQELCSLEAIYDVRSVELVLKWTMSQLYQ